MNQQLFIASFLNAIYNISIGNFETSTWILPFTMSVPFKTEEIWKWFILLSIELQIGIVYSTSITSAVCYFLCCCLYITAICDHFNLIMHSIMEEFAQPQQNENPKKYQNRYQQIQKFSKAVEIHGKVFK